MKWRHWAILIILVLLNYIIFSTAFTQLAKQQAPQPRPTRTPQPTFVTIDSSPVGWVVLPTSTSRPTRTPITPTPTTAITATVSMTPTVELTTTGAPPATEAVEAPPATPSPLPTDTPVPPTATPSATPVLHTIKEGETLSGIAQQYGVTVEAISEANGITDPSRIVTGQQLIIPAPSQFPPAATAQPTATKPPPKPTKKPPPPTPTTKPTSATAGFQFTAEVVWDPMVAPNCSGPSISKESIIRDAAGNPINGVVVEVNCYDNIWATHPSGTPGEYDAGHYDFSPGQSSPQAWTCTARVLNMGGQPVQSSQVASIQFDTNDCNPHGSGHQSAIVNWTKHW